MAHCILCNVKIGFLNRPLLGAGKLKDGSELCFKCFSKSSNTKLSMLSGEELKSVIREEKDTVLDIKEQIKNLGLDNVYMFLGRKEINELPNILAENEKIDNITQGTYNNSNGILVSTNRRLIFIDKGLVFGLKVEDFPLDKITSIQYETGLMFGKIKIHTSGNNAVIDNVDKNSARSFSEFVRNKLSEPKSVSQTVIQNTSLADELQKLSELKEKGILSEEEFTKIKMDLISK